MKQIRTFASDNYSTTHPNIIDFLATINVLGHDAAYGHDEITRQAKHLFEKEFDKSIEVLFVTTGTAANILSMKLLLGKSYDAVITSDASHIFEEETGALSSIVGAHIFTVPHTMGKITLDSIKHEAEFRKSLQFHSAQPKVVSIASTTEYGTYYTIDEIKEISSYCHANDMYLHVDGCRLANAVAEIGCTLREYIRDTGVDVLSFGGAKNGLMNAEAVVIFNAPESDFLRMQKQSLQLVSKMRYVAGQFIPYLKNGLWLQNALIANYLAKYLADGLSDVLKEQVLFTQPIVSNQIFCKLPKDVTVRLRSVGHLFYDWNSEDEIRFVTSWDNTKKDVDDLLLEVAKIRTSNSS